MYIRHRIFPVCQSWLFITKYIKFLIRKYQTYLKKYTQWKILKKVTDI